jgi:hypothetical protein
MRARARERLGEAITGIDDRNGPGERRLRGKSVFGLCKGCCGR